MKKGIWKKERAVRRKYSGGDEHRRPKAHTQSKYWVGGYTRDGQHIAGHWRTNPNFQR
ncbi:MAG: hypothetical protein HY566_02015 [Candidatus Kerfeldbacteria bacterium]|nr:hypothetical protein [Candidatus Kerfeldbacteria bacterium]